MSELYDKWKDIKIKSLNIQENEETIYKPEYPNDVSFKFMIFLDIHNSFNWI